MNTELKEGSAIKVGDNVIVNGTSISGSVTKGVEAVVISIDTNGKYTVEVDMNGLRLYFMKEDVVLLVERTKPNVSIIKKGEARVGDTVRIVKSHDMDFVEGDVGVVDRIDSHNRIMSNAEKQDYDCKYSVIIEGEKRSNWLHGILEVVGGEFKKEDLKTGMRVKLRGGKLHIVILGEKELLIDANNCHLKLDRYNDDMTFSEDEDNKEFDIVKVFAEPEICRDMLNPLNISGGMMWERVEQVTLVELEKILGFKVEVVK